MKKFCCTLVCLLVLAGLFVGVVNAQLPVNRYVAVNATGQGSSWVMTGNNLYIGQYFTLTQSFDPTIFSFSLWHNGVYQTNVPKGCTLIVYEMSGYTLTNEIIRVSFDATNLPTTVQSVLNFNITSGGGVTLNAGQRYMVALTQDDSSPSLTTTRWNDASSNVGANAIGVMYGANAPSTSWSGCFLNMQIFGQLAGSTVDGNIVYVFQNVGFDNSNVGGNVISLNLIYATGNVAVVSVPVGGNYTFIGSPLKAVSWNFSSALDLIRTIEFLPTDGQIGGQQMFQLRAASPDYVVGAYVFNVVDYTGSAQWVEVSLGGVLVERLSIGLGGSVDFSLYKGLAYTVSVLGTEGAFSQGFIAGNVFNNNIIVLAGSFGEVVFGNGQSVVFSVLRMGNNSEIQVAFNDPSGVGQFVFIIFKNVGSGSFEVYSGGVSGEFFPYVFVWNGAEVDVTYTVQGFQYDDGVLLKSWVVVVAPSVSKSNPWAVLLAPFMRGVETLPGSDVLPVGFDIAQWPAIAVILGILAIFSWKSHGIGSILAWVVAAIMFGLGWLTLNLPAFGFALFVAIIILIVEGKRTEREL